MLHRPGIDVFQIIELGVIMRQSADVGEIHPLPARRLEDRQVGAVRQALVNFVRERVSQRIRGRFRQGADQRPIFAGSFRT